VTSYRYDYQIMRQASNVGLYVEPVNRGRG